MGSLLRPPELKAARERYAAGELSAAEFKRIEDDAMDEVVRLQEEAGLPVVTDGEMRRESFQSQLAEAIEGFGEPSIEAYLWGYWRGGEEVGDKLIARPENLGVVGKLRRRRHLSVEEFVYLRARTMRTPKVTLPSPSLFANFWSPETSKEAYPTLDDFLDAVAEILREEVEELVRLGTTHIQLDAPQYPLLLEEKTRRFYEERGWALSPADSHMASSLTTTSSTTTPASRSASTCAGATRGAAGSPRAPMKCLRAGSSSPQAPIACLWSTTTNAREPSSPSTTSPKTKPSYSASSPRRPHTARPPKNSKPASGRPPDTSL